MNFDPATLGAVSIALSGLMGLLLLFSWCQSRKSLALLWCGGFLVGGFGVGVLGLQYILPHYGAESALGNALVLLGVGCKYCGCRSFNGRPAHPVRAFLGAAASLVGWAFKVPPPESLIHPVASVAAIYLIRCGWELLTHAVIRLAPQYAAGAVYLAAGLACLSRGLFRPFLPPDSWAETFVNGWSPGWALLVLLYIPAIAFLLLA